MQGKDNIRFYHGSSMTGTFRSGDCLIMTPVILADIHLGDVIVYSETNHRGEMDEVVHRVIAILPEGLVTIGDSNPRADANRVSADNLAGRVTQVERNGTTRPVRGGRLGLVHMRLFRARLAIWKLAKYLGRRPYRWSRDSNLIPRLWHPAVTKLHLTTQKGPLIKYICNGRTVAQWWEQSQRFECRKPYDLVLRPPDEA